MLANPARATLTVTSAAVLAVATLAACGSSGGSATPSSPAAASPVVQLKTITGKATTITLSTAFTTALSALHLTPKAVAPATLTASTLTLPVKGGSLTVYPSGHSPRATGSIQHTGGIQLTALGQRVQLTDVTFGLGAKPTLNGTVAINGAPLGANGFTLFDVDISRLGAPTTAGGTTKIAGATVYVDPSAATALNAAFKLTGTSKALPTTAPGLEVGTATVELTG